MYNTPSNALAAQRRAPLQATTPFLGPEPLQWTTPTLQQQDCMLMMLPTVVCLRILEACGLRHTPMNPTSATCKLMRSRILDEVLLIVAGAEAGLDVARKQCIAALDMFADRHLLQRIQHSNSLLHAITWKDFGAAYKPHIDVERVVNCARILQGDLPPEKASLEAEWSDSRSWLRRHPQRMNDRAQSWGLKQLVHIVLGPFVSATVAARDVVTEAFQDPSLSPEKLERYSRVAAILSAACRIIVSATLSADLPQLEKRVQYLRRAERFASGRLQSRKSPQIGSVKPPSSTAISRCLASGVRPKSELVRRVENHRTAKEELSTPLSEHAVTERCRPTAEMPVRKLEVTPRCASPSEHRGRRPQESDFGPSQHSSIITKSPNRAYTSRYSPPPSVRSSISKMPSLDISRVTHSSTPSTTSARSESAARLSQLPRPSSPKVGSPRASGSPKPYHVKTSPSREDVPFVPNSRCRDPLRLRNSSPVLRPRSAQVADIPIDLLTWTKEAALVNNRSSEVASLLHKEAFVFNEVRRAAPEQLLASLMGVSGLKAGECLALTNAMSRLMPDSKDYCEGKDVIRN